LVPFDHLPAALAAGTISNRSRRELAAAGTYSNEELVVFRLWKGSKCSRDAMERPGDCQPLANSDRIMHRPPVSCNDKWFLIFNLKFVALQIGNRGG
jgi:hypothetical protein